MNGVTLTENNAKKLCLDCQDKPARVSYMTRENQDLRRYLLEAYATIAGLKVSLAEAAAREFTIKTERSTAQSKVARQARALSKLQKKEES